MAVDHGLQYVSEGWLCICDCGGDLMCACNIVIYVDVDHGLIVDCKCRMVACL